MLAIAIAVCLLTATSAAALQIPSRTVVLSGGETVAAAAPRIPLELYTGRDSVTGVPRYITRTFTDNERRMLREHFGVDDVSLLYRNDEGFLVFDSRRDRGLRHYVNTHRLGARSWLRTGETYRELELRVHGKPADYFGPGVESRREPYRSAGSGRTGALPRAIGRSTVAHRFRDYGRGDVSKPRAPGVSVGSRRRHNPHGDLDACGPPSRRRSHRQRQHARSDGSGSLRCLTTVGPRPWFRGRGRLGSRARDAAGPHKQPGFPSIEALLAAAAREDSVKRASIGTIAVKRAHRSSVAPFARQR